jgi:hypothetical protein
MMTTRRFLGLIAMTTLILAVASEIRTAAPDRSESPVIHRNHAEDANDLTIEYEHSRFARWQIRGTATGNDDAVLCVSIAIVLDDSMVEALQYGGGFYDVYAGGIQGFMKERRFRGVTYVDKTGRVWMYGIVSPNEARAAATLSTVR